MQTRRNDSLAMVFTILAGLTVLLVAQHAWADAMGGLTSKVEAIRTTFRTIAGVIVGIGAIWCGLKFIKGDQDAWNYTWKFLLGASIIFASGEIIAWLKSS